MIEFDVETTGLQPWSHKQKAFLYQFYDPDVGDAEALRPETDGARIQWWFDRGAEKGLRCWNAKFDRAFADISEFDIPGDGVWQDGMIVAHTVNERRSVALQSVHEELFGKGSKDTGHDVKAWLIAERARRKKAAKEAGVELIEPNYSDVPDQIIRPYGLQDVIQTREVCDTYEPLLAQAPELQGVYDFEMKVLDALYAMERRGLPADEEGYRRLELEVIENLDVLEADCQSLAGLDEFNPNSSHQIIEALERRGADMSFMATSGGKVVSADKDNLLAVDDELAAAILKFRSEFRVLSTYVRPMIDRSYDKGMRMWNESYIAPDSRIHANYRQVGARTGRMSCSNPNMQNQPRDDLRLRYNIRADEGCKLVVCDLSGIEMRLFAAYAGSGKMLTAAHEGADFHALTAELLGIKDRTRAGGEIETAKQRGKQFNFSQIYGGGIRTIRKQQRCDQNHGRLLKRRFEEAYPEIVDLKNRIQFRLEDDGYIKDLWGRRYRCWNAKKEAYKFVNYLIQGSAAEVLKEAVVKLHADGVPIVALVHDEVLAHVPEKDAPEIKELVDKRLTEAAAPGGKLWDEAKNRPIVPLESDGDIVDRWSQAKKKEFVPKWVNQKN